ncbi:M20 family metallopeptidase [Mesorhizobium sp. BR1-1-16]|uniref:M20 aminoacylase family protein n=1 Tax=Mesorhizobium sp. BR1-1-16 TaxID=2876653 RepID=UPI001CCCDC84|nr:M20 aminoacylase family protein [Mesorhizobium sp. BR1-1-16]MBZ9935699.1 M20 family metallopeptidase [Mesorhizobium sp. BR1-1-16]
MPIVNRIADFHADMTAWRQDLHRHPEVALEEHRTSAVIQEKLKEFGVDEIITGLAGTGVVGVIHGAKPGRAIGLRADIDALPIHEESGVPHASTTAGVMHACGHDGHTAMLLGAARYLAETRNFDGTVYAIFQPAEELHGGGGMMVREGLFERCPMDLVFGMHNWPKAPAGEFLWRVGPTMAAVSRFTITITGRGAHGAQPHDGVDPIVVAGAIVAALQSIVGRNVPPLESAVVTIGEIRGGGAFNVIPSEVMMRGTTRWYLPEIGDLIESAMQRIVRATAEAYGATAELVYERTYPATINDGPATELSKRAAEAVAGERGVSELPQPTMGGEDFSFMLNAKQGSYIMLGSARTDDDPQLHHPRYDFNDEVLPVGASYWATLAEQLLPRSAA